MVTMTEAQFHAQRRLFVVTNLLVSDMAPSFVEVTFSDPAFVGSHVEWFTSSWDLEEGPRPDIETCVRGYFDHTGVYFYKGTDFRGDEHVVAVAHQAIDVVRTFIQRAVAEHGYDYNSTPVFAGVRVGKPGERWEPLQRLDI